MDYIFDFIGAINDDNIIKLMNYVKQLKNANSITINISSGGGSVLSGITIYNFLKKIPFVVNTHNMGEVSSSAVLLYLAGSTRTAEDVSKFMIHPVTIGMSGDLPYNRVKELLGIIETDIKNYEVIVNSETNNLESKYDAEHYLKNESLVLNKQQAFECNIVTNL